MSRLVAFFVLSFMSILWTSSVEAKDTDQPGKLTIIFFAGFMSSAPQGLNDKIETDASAYQDLYVLQYQYWLNRFTGYEFVNTHKVPYERLPHHMPMGIKLKLDISDKLSISTFVQYIGRTMDGLPDFTLLLKDAQYTYLSDNRAYDRYEINTQCWIPGVGLEYRFSTAAKFNWGGYADAGLTVLSCAIRESYLHTWKSAFNSGAIKENRYELNLEGNGLGWMGEIGLFFEYRVAQAWSLRCETGYRYARTPAITGTGRLLNNAYTAAWAGEWYTLSGKRQDLPSDLAEIRYPHLDPDLRSGSEPFSLNLSGMMVKVGLGINF